MRHPNSICFSPDFKRLYVVDTDITDGPTYPANIVMFDFDRNSVSADLVAMPEATQPADVLWLHLFYHDLHTALIQARGATAARFNRAAYERLKPGGSYVIVDHAAAVGAGVSDTQSLHRIEPAFAREEVEAAGFLLDAESAVLAKRDDPHSLKVFDPSIKGKTDRFAYRFLRP